MTEFTVVLNEEGNLDIFVDGERKDFGLSPEDVKDYAEDLISSNLTV